MRPGISGPRRRIFAHKRGIAVVTTLEHQLIRLARRPILSMASGK